jgi:hypothetical protein
MQGVGIMEEFYYRCKQILEEILASQGFTARPENTAGLGCSIRFTGKDLRITWLYDLRDRVLILMMERDRKRLAQGLFYSPEQLQEEFLPGLEEMLTTQGLVIPEKHRQLALEDLAAFQPTKKQKGFLSGLFGRKHD